MRPITILTTGLVAFAAFAAAQDQTYAEKLGWPKGTRAVILHVDDAGMSYDSDVGTIRAIEEGVATSLSVMMPCPWVPDIVRWIKKSGADAGLHLTLTSEWDVYRWGPVAGKAAVPGLVDEEGCLWDNVPLVVKNATPDEVEKEVRAQLERARSMGFEPTHLDSHMGTLFATDAFLERYIKVGIEEKVPVMFPGGHGFFVQQTNPGREATRAQIGKTIWDAGLPVIDDLHNFSYDWKTTDKTDKYIEAIKGLKTGVTMMIMHCTQPTEVFEHISSSGDTRLGDLNAMVDPKLKEAITAEGVVLTTWRELKERRDKIGK
ncbi:MAG: polysaccharide deacetylase family protein [Candidatus Hydrogenedentota bacterium]